MSVTLCPDKKHMPGHNSIHMLVALHVCHQVTGALYFALNRGMCRQSAHNLDMI